MTQDEIIRMARDAGFAPNSSHTVLPMKDYSTHGISYELERFAALVAAHERDKTANQVKPTIWKNTVDEVRFKEPVNSCQKSTELVDIEAAVLAEREACAKVCDEKFDDFCESKDDWFNGFASGSHECAAAIRARGENGTA